MAAPAKRLAYWCVKPSCTGYRYVDVAKARGETSCKLCSTPFSADMVRVGPPAGARRRPGGAGGDGAGQRGRADGGGYKPPGGGPRSGGGGAGAGPKPLGLQQPSNHLQSGNPETGARPQGQARRRGGGGESSEVIRFREGLVNLEALYGADSEVAEAARRKLAEAEQAAEARLTAPQRLDRHRRELDAARQALASTFEKVRDLGQEKLRIDQAIEEASNVALVQHATVEERESKVRALEKHLQLNKPMQEGLQVDTSTANQLHELAKKQEQVYRDSIRRQKHRELTPAEERRMQDLVYGTSSFLSQPLEEEEEFGPNGTPRAQDGDMEDDEEGMRSKKARSAKQRSEAEIDAIAREGLDREDEISDMEMSADERENAWEQLGGDPEVQKLAKLVRPGGETIKTISLRMVKPKASKSKGKGKGKDLPSPTVRPSMWDVLPDDPRARRPSDSAFPPLQGATGRRTPAQASAAAEQKPAAAVPDGQAVASAAPSRTGAGPQAAGTPRDSPTGSLAEPSPGGAGPAAAPGGSGNQRGGGVST